MATISIIAGSKSDEKFVKQAENVLTDHGIVFETQYLSAHRNKKELEEYVTQSDADYFIAMAGLSAALPGSIAVDTKKPVIGVPLGGLDALLAVIQMPPPKDGKNVAVGGVAINRADCAAEFVCNLIGQQNMSFLHDVCVMYTEDNVLEDVTKLRSTLDELGLSHTITQKPRETDGNSALYIFISSDWDERASIAKIFSERSNPLISVPIKSKTAIKVETALSSGSDVPELMGRNAYVELYHTVPAYPVVSVGYSNPKNAAYLAKRILRK